MNRKTIIAGGRDFEPTEEHEDWVVEILKKIGTSEVVSGGARGADKFGEEIAQALRLDIKTFPANWNSYGKRAGFLRNQTMAKYADSCIILPGGEGTKHMTVTAMKEGLDVFVWSKEG